MPDSADGRHALGQTTYLVTLGQGAFFFSTLFLPIKLGGRIVLGSLVIALGLGFYLIGGSVAPTHWIAVGDHFAAAVLETAVAAAGE